MVQPGTVTTGTVDSLQDFGAFVRIDPDDAEPVTGLVHVSEIDTDFVENIYAYLTEGEEVEVKVLDVKPDGKVDLSIKRTDPDWRAEETPEKPKRNRLDKGFNKRLRRFMHRSQMIQGERRRQQRGRLGND